MGLIYPNSKWCQTLWQGHVARFPSAQQCLAEGSRRQPAFPAFGQDIHDALYLRHTPDAQDGAPDWATHLLDDAQQLPEWALLRQRCLNDGFAAGVATEQLLQALTPLVPTAQPATSSSPRDGSADDAATGGAGHPGTEHDSAHRRTLRQACRDASQAVDRAEQCTEATQAVLNGRGQGHGPGTQESLHDLNAVRALYAMLRDNPTLRAIADLAGRLHRLGQAHKKTLVTPAVGAVHGITLGGDLERVLPSELAGLRSGNRLARLRTLDTLLGKRALQYLMRGQESLTRGPIIALVDESWSMRNGEGSAGAWSKAVCLALLTQATEQGRAFYLVGFSSRVQHEFGIGAGERPGLEAVCAALTRRCSGGTDFDAPLQRALQILRDVPSMRQADIVLITDGEARIGTDIAAQLQAVRATEGVQLYALLVGNDATGKSLTPVASQCWHVTSTAQGAQVAPLLAQVG